MSSTLHIFSWSQHLWFLYLVSIHTWKHVKHLELIIFDGVGNLYWAFSFLRASRQKQCIFNCRIEYSSRNLFTLPARVTGKRPSWSWYWSNSSEAVYLEHPSLISFSRHIVFLLPLYGFHNAIRNRHRITSFIWIEYLSLSCMMWQSTASFYCLRVPNANYWSDNWVLLNPVFAPLLFQPPFAWIVGCGLFHRPQNLIDGELLPCGRPLKGSFKKIK